MVMCCEKMTMTGWRNVWSMKLRVQDQGEDQRRPWKEVVREDCQARKLNKEDAMDRCKWWMVIKEARWPGWVWVGECFFWYRPTRVIPDQRPLNGRWLLFQIGYTASAFGGVAPRHSPGLRPWPHFAHPFLPMSPSSYGYQPCIHIFIFIYSCIAEQQSWWLCIWSRPTRQHRERKCADNYYKWCGKFII